MIKVLIIGGGGVFGMIPVEFLSHVGVTDISEQVEVIGGTSIGGIIGLYLSHGKSAHSLKINFKNSVADIFNKPFWRSFNPCLSTYPASNIEPFLKEHLPLTLGELKTHMIVPTLDFLNERPKIFDNIIIDRDLSVPAWQIGRATSAAPTFFPPFGDDILLDGGIVENLPVMTVTSAIKDKMGIDFKDMRVLVIGTGQKEVKKKTVDSVSTYGPFSWLRNLLVPFVTKSNEIASNYWAKRLGFQYYEYFDPVSIDGDMDDATQVTSGKLSKSCEPFLANFDRVWEDFLNE